MAKPRITRLGDAGNPYGGKKTPTRARTDKEKMEALARSRRTPDPSYRTAKRSEAKDSPYMAARKRAIDGAVDRADPPRRRKK